MSRTFFHAKNFNQPLDSWSTSKVTTMFAMFAGATQFTSDLSGWDVGNVTNMDSLFW